MESQWDDPPTSDSSVGRPFPSPSVRRIAHPSAPRRGTRKGLLRQQAARMKMGKSLSPRFLASNTSKLHSNGRKMLKTIPETRAIRQQLTYGLLSDTQRPRGFTDPATKEKERKRMGKGKKMTKNSKAQTCNALVGKKDSEDETFEDCLEEVTASESDLVAEKEVVLMLGGRLPSNDTEDRRTKSPESQGVGQLGQLPIEKGSDGTNGILTVVSLNVQTNPTFPKTGYKQDVEGRSADSTSLEELHMQTNGPLKVKNPFC